MSDVYLGQIMLAGFNFAPRGFALCNGQLLPLSQNTALFSLLGTNYGGNGTTSFALPDLQGRTPVGAGSSVDPNWQPSPYPVGTPAGVENVTLLLANLPQHSHLLNATTTATVAKNPTNAIYGMPAEESLYGPASSNLVPLAPTDVTPTGGNQAHNNMQPFLTVNFTIALTGNYPSRN
jgi:microcystin-dependent protein